METRKKSKDGGMYNKIGQNYVIKRLREAGVLDSECKGVDNAIAELKAKLGKLNEASPEIDNLILEAFNLGVSAGFSKALDKFQDGSIKTQKVSNEDSWNLNSDSKFFKAKEVLPSVNDKFEATVTITLSTHGFE
ncbi:hypothetical protein PTRA_b0197 [Pseudoalteromonas translucida KMM 520]|uniref:Uncharacterized protein n=1 Tax=Pseudoalteromonas translucida KMM 520 TaxID=1315283 RepID=A0A0U2VAS2_9GAMM|nr:hypothetical protein [Pseudoalteromonas translucida]ALS34716.1 hypothetical protein PTRA_b0197 [Pseudoalteromonas translucida KMM 520]